MADEYIQLQPMPEPGVAIFPQNQSTSQIDLVMQSDAMYTTWSIDFADGRPFLKVKSPMLTMSSRKNILDAATGNKICDLRSKSSGGSRTYYAQSPNDSTPLLEIKNRDLNSEIWSSGKRYQTALKFTDAMTNVPEELHLQGDTSINQQNAVICRGLCCGIIDEKIKYGRRVYRLSVAPGFDPFLIAVLAVNLDEKERVRTGKAANFQAMTGGPLVGVV